ncbi:complement factor B [Candoia aspera]|uniref:complement factor B n=1 Tax=Candoia aspera TaxID=51853 RepID=UPI002FD8075A
MKKGAGERTEAGMQRLGPFLHLLLLLGVLSEDTVDGACDPKAAEIIGGTYTLLQNGIELMYDCPQGQYPYPTQFRSCNRDSQWSPMTDKRNIIQQAVCKDVYCVKPVQFEYGDYEPHQRYYNVGQELRFSCYGGFNLHGSQIRTCLPSGKWSGETAICDDGNGHCPDPGIPVGAQRTGVRHQIGSTVRYQCNSGLYLIGSKERVCQEVGTWSGSEPECRSPFTFDSKEDISTKFLPSISDIAVSASQGASANNRSDPLNVYFVLDNSRSFGTARFTKAEKALAKLIEKISSYDILANYGIVIFARDSRTILRTTDPQSSNADWVIEKLSSISSDVYPLRSGSNTGGGLQSVYQMMVLQDEEEKRQGLNPTPVSSTTHHVIILITDGNYNMGGSPVVVIQQMKQLLNIGQSSQDPRDDYLDIFVFGNGPDINMEIINELASHKPNERHSFILKDLDELQEGLGKSGDGESLPICGFSPGQEAADDYQKFPWFARIVVNEPRQETCNGVIVADQYIMTAAHCFAGINRNEDLSVILGTAHFAVAEIRRHPEYNSQKLQNKGIQKFYDYDVALVKLTEKHLPSFARPVCLPCTVETTRILRKPHPQTTCKDHEEELLYDGNIPSFFISNCKYSHGQESGLLRRDVWIKSGEKKTACLLDAKKASQFEKIANISEVVTENFLCTGGMEPYADPNICLHDAGGPLLIQRRLRYIQLGLISWSLDDACKGDVSFSCDSEQGKRLPYTRDFHISTFKMLPWLKEQLREHLDFL